MLTNSKEALTRVFHTQANEDKSLPSARPFGIQKNMLTMALGLASLVLAVGSIFVSLYIFKTGLQALQHAQADLNRQTVPKVRNETVTAAAEAKFAEELNRLRTINAKLESGLIQSQSLLAHAETGKAKAEEKVAQAEATLRGINAKFATMTTGDPQFQAAVGRMWAHYVTPTIDCLAPKSNESKADFQKRCRDKNIFESFKNTLPPIRPVGELSPSTRQSTYPQ